jgi:Transcriptional regulator PadR-like family
MPQAIGPACPAGKLRERTSSASEKAPSPSNNLLRRLYIWTSQYGQDRDSLQGTLDLLVLKTLSRRPHLHGYALMAAIHDLSRDALRLEGGSLYPALHRMEEAGWVKATGR